MLDDGWRTGEMATTRRDPNIHEVPVTVADFRWKGEIEPARVRVLRAGEIDPLGVTDDSSEFLSIDEYLEFHGHLRRRLGVRPTPNPPVDGVEVADDVRVVAGVEAGVDRASGEVSTAIGHSHGDLMILTVIETHSKMQRETTER